MKRALTTTDVTPIINFFSLEVCPWFSMVQRKNLPPCAQSGFILSTQESTFLNSNSFCKKQMIQLLNRCPLIKTDHITKRLFDPYEQGKFYKRKELYSNPGKVV